MTTAELGPLPERAAFERYFANSRRNRGAGRQPNFARLQDGTYLDNHVQRHWWTWQHAVAAERELSAQHIAALEQEIARQKEVIASVNARCDHLGMSLRDIKAERDAEREMWRELVREALDADEGDHVLGKFLADRMRAALWP